MHALPSAYHIDVIEHFEAPTIYMIWADATHQQLIARVEDLNPHGPSGETIARQIAHGPRLIAALRGLVTADSRNYDRDTMRYEGFFDAGRQVLEAAGEI